MRGFYKEIFLTLIVLSCVLLSFLFSRPIWIDEVVQFALGSYDSTNLAWQVFINNIGVNHGQTGAYYMADHWLIKTFGASTFWLRFPSLIYGFFLFFSAVYLFRLWGLSFVWQVFGCLALFSNPWLAEYIGEARPYLPLAACSVGVLTYYCIPWTRRKEKLSLFIGYFSVVSGSLFHPYFSVYWCFTLLFGWLYQVILLGEPARFKTFIRHSNVFLIVLGLSLYFSIGFATWLTHSQKFSMDPFAFIPEQFWFVRYLFSIHYQSLAKIKIPFVTMMALMLTVYLAAKKVTLSGRSLLMCALLSFSAIGISAFLSYMSYRVSYWILQRQWIASIALVTLTIPWFGAIVSNLFSNRFKIASTTFFLCWMLLQAGLAGWDRGKRIYNWQNPSPYSFLRGEVQKFDQEEPAVSISGWENLANANCVLGGKIWKVFRKFYAEPQRSKLN